MLALWLLGCGGTAPPAAPAPVAVATNAPAASSAALPAAPSTGAASGNAAQGEASTPVAPSAQELAQLSAELSGAFRRQLLPFWYPRTKSDKGGFLQHVTFDGKLEDDGSRFSVFQARVTWVAAETARRFPELAAEYTQYTRHGLDFLQQKLWDKQHGGFHFELGPGGKPADEKHAYGIAFAIYASAAGARTTGDAKDKAFAQKAFEWFDDHAHDAKNGGYFEPLTRAGKPVLAAPQPGAKDGIGTEYGKKSMNTHIHVLEAFSELYRLAPAPRLRARLEEVFLLVRDKVTAPDGHFHLYLEPDFRPVTQGAKDSYGHNIEGAFLLLEAAEVLGKPNDPATLAVALKLVEHALERGWDRKHQGLYNEGEAGGAPSDLQKIWWVQAESLNGLLAVYAANPSGGARYFEAFRKQWAFIKAHVIDARHGEWRAYLQGDGSPVDPKQDLASKWKAGYHSGRALLHNAELLAQLAERAKP